MRRERPRRREGFTLLETSVTIVVMGVVAMLGYAAFAALIDRRTQLRAAMVETERAAALRAMLEGWFVRSYVQGPQPRGPTPAGVGGPSKDVLSFITRAPTPSRGWATVMIMFIDNNPSTPERGLTVRHLGYTPTSGAPWLTYSDLETVPPRTLLADGWIRVPTAYQLDSLVTGLRVEYLDRRTNRWVSSQDATGIQPLAVRVTLEGAPNAPLPPLLRLPFLIAHHDHWGTTQ